MNSKLKKTLFIFTASMLAWGLLTLWVEYAGGEKSNAIGNKTAAHTAIIIYNPDPIYNFDEQVCKQFAKGLSKHNFYAKVATVESAKKDTAQYHLYVFCANTYNWAPDWLVKEHIETHAHLSHKNTVAITLGAGSTEQAQRILEATINDKKAKLLGSKTYWLLRPNDESRLDENNVDVALEMAEQFGGDIGKGIKK